MGQGRGGKGRGGEEPSTWVAGLTVAWVGAGRARSGCAGFLDWRSPVCPVGSVPQPQTRCGWTPRVSLLRVGPEGALFETPMPKVPPNTCQWPSCEPLAAFSLQVPVVVGRFRQVRVAAVAGRALTDPPVLGTVQRPDRREVFRSPGLWGGR